MKNDELTWIEKLKRFSVALAGLRQAARIVENDDDAEQEVDALLRDGVMYRFTQAYGLAMQTMMAYTTVSVDNAVLLTDKDVVEQALAMKLVGNKQWLDMVQDNESGENADKQVLFERILLAYVPLMARFEEQMQARITPL
ncbi:MAG: nucleotidyltransferase substrate binding protein [Marinifilaceae bacterium]